MRFADRGSPLSAKNLMYNHIHAQPHFQAPSDEGAVERSETEGEKAINIKLSLSLPQPFFFEKRQLPRQREPVSDSRKAVPTVQYIFQFANNR